MDEPATALRGHLDRAEFASLKREAFELRQALEEQRQRADRAEAEAADYRERYVREVGRSADTAREREAYRRALVLFGGETAARVAELQDHDLRRLAHGRPQTQGGVPCDDDTAA